VAATGGACPPIGRHRYFHKLYALDRTLSLQAPATKAEVEAAAHQVCPYSNATRGNLDVGLEVSVV
jgi:phosphatidylethanolamine-binding protein (PEBP) family uncharacterized protein